MQRRVLGRTGLEVSVVGFGAGPVSGLMTGADEQAQREVLARTLAAGINWIDTAPGYGAGQSEASLGRALTALQAHSSVHLATKVRLQPADFIDVEAAVRHSLAGSLARLGCSAVALVQLHNGITEHRGDIAASLTPADVLGSGGVADAFDRIRADGLVRFIGLTGTGTSTALQRVIDSGRFDTIQIPHHVLSPADPAVLARCQAHAMGIFAIRVFAGGALLGQPPSAHTLKTPYFPLAVYEEEHRRAIALEKQLHGQIALKELALRFALSGAPHVALIGLGQPQQVDEAAMLAEHGPLPPSWLDCLAGLRLQ
jgi:aryl-alcohol dehydrogenase-like predicted oxidoreductase